MLDYFIRIQHSLLQTDMDNPEPTLVSTLLESTRIIGIIGKSTLMKDALIVSYLKKFSIYEILYIDCRECLIQNLNVYRIIEEFYLLKGKVVVLDNLHLIKERDTLLQNLYYDFIDLSVRFTSLPLFFKTHSLYSLIRLPYPSFRDYINKKNKTEFKEISLHTLLSQHTRISREYIFSYPTLYHDFKSYLSNQNDIQNSYQTLSQRTQNDFDMIVPNKNPYVIEKLFFKIAKNGGCYKLNLSSLARELESTTPTLYHYLETIQKAHLLFGLKKFQKKISTKPDKLYFSHTSHLYAVANRYGFDIDPIALKETFFLNHVNNVYLTVKNSFISQGTKFSFSSLKPNSEKMHFEIVDVDFSVNENKIPLWLFGFLR